MKQCTEAPFDIKHASVKARVYVGAKAKRIKTFKCVAYAKKERKISDTTFQTQLNSKFHNLPNMQTVILPLLIQTNPYQTKTLKHS